MHTCVHATRHPALHMKGTWNVNGKVGDTATSTPLPQLRVDHRCGPSPTAVFPVPVDPCYLTYDPDTVGLLCTFKKILTRQSVPLQFGKYIHVFVLYWNCKITWHKNCVLSSSRKHKRSKRLKETRVVLQHLIFYFWWIIISTCQLALMHYAKQNYRYVHICGN